MTINLFSFNTLPRAVKALMVVHVGAYLAQWIAWGPVSDALALSPARVIGDLWLWQPLTYLFVHPIGVLGFLFFLIHMYLLSMIGRDLELRWGSFAFVAYYLVCGAAGGIVVTALGRFAPPTLLGSSTALLALLTAFATLAPDAQLVFYFIPMTARQLIWLVAALEVLLSVARLLPWVEAAGELTAMGAGFLLVRHRVLDTDWMEAWSQRAARRHAEKYRLQIVDMEQEVDKILDKVLKKGADSLSRGEQELMQRYSKSKK